MLAKPFVVVPLPLGAIATGNALVQNPADHLAEFDTIGMTWRSSGNTNLWVRGDFGAALPVDFMSLVWANAVPATTIRLRLGDTQAEVDGTAEYDTGALPFIDPAITRSDGLYSCHIELPTVQTKQWWRIDIGGHTGSFEAAKLIMGVRQIPANFYSAGWQYGAEDLGDIDLGRWGVPAETPGLIMRSLAFKLGWMTETEFETMFRPIMETLGKRRVALWCFDPTAGPYRQARTYFGWLRDVPYATGGTAVTRYEMEFQIRSMV